MRNIVDVTKFTRPASKYPASGYQAFFRLFQIRKPGSALYSERNFIVTTSERERLGADRLSSSDYRPVQQRSIDRSARGRSEH
jgi:hypothetical protein